MNSDIVLFYGRAGSVCFRLHQLYLRTVESFDGACKLIMHSPTMGRAAVIGCSPVLLVYIATSAFRYVWLGVDFKPIGSSL